MIGCQTLRDHLDKFLAGELQSEEHTAYQEHLAACAACAAYLEDYREIIRLANQLPDAPVPPALQARFRQALKAPRPTKPKPE